MASEDQAPEQGEHPDAEYKDAPASQYGGQEHQNVEDQGSEYYGDQDPGKQNYQNVGMENYPDHPDSQYAESQYPEGQYDTEQGSQYPEGQYDTQQGSQYPEGQYDTEQGSQYPEGQYDRGQEWEEGEEENFEKTIPKGAHPHFGEPSKDAEGITLEDYTGGPDPETSEGAALYVLKDVLKEVGVEADEHTLEKKFGKQFKGPEKPTDIEICDKYFIKPGEFGVTASGNLFPGTGERPPNAPIDEFQFPDDTEAKGDSLASFLELIDKCSVEFPEKGEDRESDSDMELDAYDSEYIKNTVGIPLTLALAEIVAKKPTDPIHYLGHWLYKWRYNQEAKQAEIDKISDLIAEREALAEAEKEKQRLADEKMTLQLLENIMDDVLDASKKRKAEPEDYFEEEGEGQMDRRWYGGDSGGDGEGYYGQYPPDYPQQGSDKYPAQGYDQYPPQEHEQGPVEGYEQFSPDEAQYMPQEQQVQY